MPVARLEHIAEPESQALPAQLINLCNPLAYSNIAGQAQLPFRHLLFTANAARWFQQPAIALHRYPAGTIVDAELYEPFAVLAAGRLVRQQLPEWVTSPDTLQTELRARAQGAPRIQAPCLLAARYGDVTWGHWLCDILPKIVLAEAVAPQRFTYVVPSRITRRGGPIAEGYVNAVLQSLAYYSVAPHRLLHVPPHQPLQFDALFDFSGIHPVPGEEFFGMHPGLMSLMNAPAAAGLLARLPARPCILRSRQGPRHIVNHDEILDCARRHGYTPVDIGTLDFASQVALFRGASSVTGALGSGFAGMIYATPGITAVTLAPVDWPDHFFVNIFQKQSCVQADIRGPVIAADQRFGDAKPFHVSPADMQAGLAMALEAATAGPPHFLAVAGARLPRHIGPERLAVTFGHGGNAARFQRGGWAAAEANHTWSTSDHCELHMPRGIIGPADCWIEAVGSSSAHNPQPGLAPMTLSVNGETLATHWITGHSRPIWFAPAALLARRDPVVLRFHHPLSPSPKSLGVSDDDRPLGFAFMRVALIEVAPAGDRAAMAAINPSTTPH